jgi:hypothetical protein
MGRIKILLMSLVVIMAGCDDDGVLVDGPAKGEWYFKIVNNTEHDVKISKMTTVAGSPEPFCDTVCIAPYDSITRKGELGYYEYHPFDSYCTFLIFDDSLYYLCEDYSGKVHELSHNSMVKDAFRYDYILKGPEVHLFRYEITEEKYRHVEEHLKIHSCKEDLDKFIEEEGWTNWKK